MDILFIIVILVILIASNVMVKTNNMTPKKLWMFAIIAFIIIIGLILIEIFYYHNFGRFPILW